MNSPLEACNNAVTLSKFSDLSGMIGDITGVLEHPIIGLYQSHLENVQQGSLAQDFTAKNASRRGGLASRSGVVTAQQNSLINPCDTQHRMVDENKHCSLVYSKRSTPYNTYPATPRKTTTTNKTPFLQPSKSNSSPVKSSKISTAICCLI